VTQQIANESECNSTYASWGSNVDHMICAVVPDGGKGACWVIGSHDKNKYLNMNNSHLIQVQSTYFIISEKIF